MSKKTLVVALALLLSIMTAGFAAADEPAFTIQVLAADQGSDVTAGTFAFMINVNNATGASLQNVKIQGGTCAWAALIDAGGFSAPLPMNPKKKAKNQNQVLVLTLPEMIAGTQTYTVVVQGDPGDYVCPGGPNVSGSWSATGTMQTGTDVEGNPVYVNVLAQALDKESQPISFIDESTEPPTVTPVYETPAVTVCDFAS